MALLKERKPGEIHTLRYWFIFPDGERKLAGDLKVVQPLPIAMQNFKFLNGRPEAARDLVMKGECKWKDHNGVTHLVQFKLDPETKY